MCVMRNFVSMFLFVGSMMSVALNATAQGTVHIQSFTFQVKVKDAKEDIQGAVVEVVLNQSIVAKGVTDGKGLLTLSVSQYKKDPAIIRTTLMGYKTKELRNVVLEAYSMYEFILKEGNGLEFEEMKTIAPPPVAVTPSGNVSKKEVKRRKKEAAKANKKEEAYRKELTLIRQDQSKNESTRGRLSQQQREIEDEFRKGSISETAANKRREEIQAEMKKVEQEDQKISERLRALDMKYGKVQ